MCQSFPRCQVTLMGSLRCRLSMGPLRCQAFRMIRSDGRPAWSGRPDQGSGTLAVIVVTMVVAVGLLIGSMVLSYVLALHKVRDASDMAALTAATQAVAGAGESWSCDEAGRIATDNGATLTSCEVQQAGPEVAACVETTIQLRWSIPGLPDHVSSTSYAGNP